MSLSNPKRLVNIFVIENPLTCVSFLQRDYVLSRTIYCAKRYTYSIINQQENAHFTELKITRFLLDGEIHLTCFWVCFHLLSQVVHLCNLFITQLRCRHPRIVFLRSLPEIVEKRKIEKNLTNIINKRYSFKGSWK